MVVAEPAAAIEHSQAVAEAFRTHAGLVERVLRRAGVAERDLGDLRQEVFVVVHLRLAQFEGRSSLSTWLYRIALNVASDHRRRAYQRRERLDGDEQGAPSSADGVNLPASDPLASAERRELLEHVLRALAALDADKREAFVLSELYELPMREVAERLGCPQKTAFSRSYAARRRILAELHKAGALTGMPLLFPVRALRGLSLGSAATSSTWSPLGWLAGATAAGTLAVVLATGALPVHGSSLVELPRAPVASAAGPVSPAGTAPVPTRRALRARTTARTAVPATPKSAHAPAPALAPAPAFPPDADDMQVVRTSAIDLRPSVANPLSAALPGPSAAPARIRLTGPRDPADGVEDSLASDPVFAYPIARD